MLPMIGHTGVYLLLALPFLLIIGGGVYLTYRMSSRSPHPADHPGSAEHPRDGRR
jgi:hypothetical protein